MRNKPERFVIALVMVVSMLSGLAVLSPELASQAVAVAQDDWKKEFEVLCSQTQDVLLFAPEELKDLIGRCAALRPRIEKLDETQKKIYLKRLQMCCDLFTYALESKTEK